MFNSVDFNFKNTNIPVEIEEDTNQENYSKLHNESTMSDVNLTENPFLNADGSPKEYFSSVDGNKTTSLSQYDNGSIFTIADNDLFTSTDYIDYDGDGSIDFITQHEQIDNVFYTKNQILSEQDKQDLNNAIANNQSYSPRTDQFMAEVHDMCSTSYYSDANNDGVLDVYAERNFYAEDGSYYTTNIKYEDGMPSVFIRDDYSRDGNMLSIYRETNKDYGNFLEKNVMFYDLQNHFITSLTNSYDVHGTLTHSTSMSTPDSSPDILHQADIRRDGQFDHYYGFVDSEEFSINAQNGREIF